MSTQVTTTRVRSHAQDVQARTLQLQAARRDKARYTRAMYRASDRSNRTLARHFEMLVAQTDADIAIAEEQLAELGALL